MPTHLLALVPWMALILGDFQRSEPPGQARAPLGNTGNICTGRLSPEQLQIWEKIVAIVMAADRSGKPLHPTLRGLWDAVNSGGHIIYIEMTRRRSYIAGRFAVTKVDAAGVAHEGIIILNLRAIDEVSTRPISARPGGFIAFKGLGRTERYAELLGHELAHAVWHLADPERARLGQELPRQHQERMQRVLSAGLLGLDQQLRQDVERLERLAIDLERTAEAAEEAIWKELQASQRAREGKRESSNCGVP